MKCKHSMCPYNLIKKDECDKGLNPNKLCYYPERNKNYKETSVDKLLNFWDDCLVVPAIIWYGITKLYKGARRLLH